MKNTQTIYTKSTEQTVQIASELASASTIPNFIALSGHLGAGKTHFIKGLGKGLGIDPATICSASFVIVAEYGRPVRLVHIDAYRIEDPQELLDIGFDDILERKDIIVAVEWAEKIKPILPKERIDVNISIIDNSHRKIEITDIREINQRKGDIKK